jgi:hypothetical protein
VEEAVLDDSMKQSGSFSSGVEFGIEGRRAQFDKDSYRQPVLTQRPLKPKNYRRGQADTEAEKVRKQLRDLLGYDLMNDDGPFSGQFQRDNNRESPANILEEPVTL